MCAYVLMDFEWTVMEPLLPNKPRGVPRGERPADAERDLLGVADRRAVAGAATRVWPVKTCHNRFVRWRKAGVWDRIMAAVTEAYDGAVQMIDSISGRVHEHAVNSKKANRIAVWAVRAAD
jgi:transposase